MEQKMYDDSELIPPFKLYPGNLLECIENLYSDNRKLLSLSEILERRLRVMSNDYSEEVEEFWWNSMIYSSECIIRKDSKIKLVKNYTEKIFSDKNKPFVYLNGALSITESEYKHLEGLEVSESSILKKNINFNQLEKNELVNYLIPNRELLREYFSVASKQSSENMQLGVYLDEPQKEKITLRIIHLSTLNDNSKICAYHHFDQTAFAKLIGKI